MDHIPQCSQTWKWTSSITILWDYTWDSDISWTTFPNVPKYENEHLPFLFYEIIHERFILKKFIPHTKTVSSGFKKCIGTNNSKLWCNLSVSAFWKIIHEIADDVDIQIMIFDVIHSRHNDLFCNIRGEVDKRKDKHESILTINLLHFTSTNNIGDERFKCKSSVVNLLHL